MGLSIDVIRFAASGNGLPDWGFLMARGFSNLLSTKFVQQSLIIGQEE